MSELLDPVLEQLDSISTALKTAISTAAPLNVSSGNWSFPGVTRAELGARVTSLRDLVADAASPSADSEKYIVSVVERLTFLNAHTVPQLASNAVNAVPAFLITLDAIEKGLAPLLTDTKALALKNSQAVKKTTTQVRSIETRLRELTPRTKSLEDMVSRIEKAYDAADQLPTDLEALAEAQSSVGNLLKLAETDKGKIEDLLEVIADYEKDLKAKSEEAEEVLQKCVSAYSSATSLGLAAAFSERSKALDWSMWGWVVGLIAALIVGGLAGSVQLHNLAYEMTKADASSFGVGINLVLSILSVGGPVWFAWLSTKQIGQRFRLSEDYAFKASISRAYEGYRREAHRIDENLEKQLLGSALARLDEQPLRLVESHSFGSPWHELLASDLVKDAAKTVPGFVEKVTSMASSALQGKKAAATTAVVANDVPPEQAEAKV
ncbi:hypothetical protein [Pseudomonas amygdali]|uniref:hypothetical protein n=1 Tax=Pseudomonas amygdali TaxID=47877 RepID=UPI0006B9FEAF|nr:hypothetical protein [Pseudomonas amygdali]KPB18423.1 Uncharacterized protein AC516_3328 [Pseudomonas amygdali pv. sesami]